MILSWRTPYSHRSYLVRNPTAMATSPSSKKGKTPPVRSATVRRQASDKSMQEHVCMMPQRDRASPAFAQVHRLHGSTTDNRRQLCIIATRILSENGNIVIPSGLCSPEWGLGAAVGNRSTHPPLIAPSMKNDVLSWLRSLRSHKPGHQPASAHWELSVWGFH